MDTSLGRDVGYRGQFSRSYESRNRGSGTPHKREGNFAVGQEVLEHHAELVREKGSFASGVALRPPEHQGTFAEGQEQEDPHPEVLENRGGFAAGRRGRSSPG